jgi:hypothetical protein
VLLRAGTSRILSWMPQKADQYDRLVLQFSANDGRLWQTIATYLTPGKPVKWTVPTVSSKNCRLRIVGEKTVEGATKRFMLVMSAEFTVDTVAPEVSEGPQMLRVAE